MSSSPPVVCLPSPIDGVEVEHTLPWSHHQSIDRLVYKLTRTACADRGNDVIYFCNQTHLCYLFCTSSIHKNKNDNMMTINNLI